jgi:hypothetical protein
MTCPSYTALTPQQQYEFIGKLVIAVQQDEHLYKMGNALIAFAHDNGIYDTVKVHADASALADLDSTPIENGIK